MDLRSNNTLPNKIRRTRGRKYGFSTPEPKKHNFIPVLPPIPSPQYSPPLPTPTGAFSNAFSNAFNI